MDTHEYFPGWLSSGVFCDDFEFWWNDFKYWYINYVMFKKPWLILAVMISVPCFHRRDKIKYLAGISNILLTTFTIVDIHSLVITSPFTTSNDPCTSEQSR